MFCVACDSLSEDSRSQLLENIRLIKDPMYTPRVEDSCMPGNYGVYMNYFNKSDNIIGLSASKPSALNQHRITGYAGPRYVKDLKSSTGWNFDVMLDGNLFSCSAVTKSGLDISNVFGNSVVFSISSRSSTKSSSERSEIELYIPEMINVAKPSIKTEEDLLPLCYYDGFVLGWNADPDNHNGVIIILEWVGDMVIGHDIPDTHIRRTCIVEDNGECVLSNALFDGIPDTAVCHLTVLRGNLERTDLDGESFNIMVESHEYLNFVLIREVKVL